MEKLSPTQECLLNIYKSFKEFCDKHHLRYLAVAGTAIGAVRHHGFIPWDDDIDLGMPIEDFNKLKKLASKSLPQNLAFKESYWMGGKIYDTRTTIIDVRFLNQTENYHGVYIDIFPLIGLPDDETARKDFVNDIKAFQTNAELLEFYHEVSPFSASEILKWKKHLQTAYSFDTAKKLAAFCYFMCDGEGSRNPIVVPFVDTEIPISSNYDWDLRYTFDDYMKMPPEAERKTHDKYHFIDLSNPYTKYIKKYNSSPEWLLKIINQNHLIEGELTQFSNSLQYVLNEKNSEIQRLNSQIQLQEQELNAFRNSVPHKIKKPIVKLIKTIKKDFHHEA